MDSVLSLLPLTSVIAFLVGGCVGIGVFFGIIANVLVKKFPKAKWAIIVVALLLAAGASFGWGYLAGIIIE